MISVCMTTHNSARFVKEQLESILVQLGDDDELIVSDDGSTDETLEIIDSFHDSRIRVVHCHHDRKDLPSHEYATRNFENALKASRGEYVFLSDHDDVWLSDKVSVTVSYLKDHPYVISDCYVTDENLNIISETRFTAEENVHFNKYAALVLSTPYQGSCAAFRREVLEKALPFPKGLQSHDRWIGDVAAFFFSVTIIPEKLIYYRRYEGTASNTFGAGRAAGLLKTISYKWIYVKNILRMKIGC